MQIFERELRSIPILHTPSLFPLLDRVPRYYNVSTCSTGKPSEEHLPRISKPFVYFVCCTSITWKPGRFFFLSRWWTRKAREEAGNQRWSIQTEFALVAVFTRSCEIVKYSGLPKYLDTHGNILSIYYVCRIIRFEIS